MKPHRRREVEIGGSRLTNEEIESGWHFCEEWDHMLIDRDNSFCTCFESIDKEIKDLETTRVAARVGMIIGGALWIAVVIYLLVPLGLTLGNAL